MKSAKEIIENEIQHSELLMLSKESLLAMKILFPENSNLQNLLSYLVANSEYEKEKYDDCEKEFVYNNESDKIIRRTLTFLSFDDCSYKYLSWSPEPCQPQTKTTSLCYYGPTFIPLSNEVKNLKLDINKVWDKWKQCIENHFDTASSTLWTYVKIKTTQDKEIIASAYLIFSAKIDKKDLIKINRFCQELLVQLFIMQQLREIEAQAVRAALAQVMTRNLSHNIGSHVLVKVIGMWVTAFVEGITDEKKQCLSNNTDTKTAKDICNKLREFAKELESNCSSCKYEDLAKKFDDKFRACFSGYGLISTLLNYLKVRFDFLADITTGTAVMENPQSIKDIIKGFENNGLLANTISGIDDFKYSIVYKNAIDTDENKDLNISVPNDVLGNHAFYTILENIIRNSAKHGKAKNIDFVVKIEEASNYCNNESEVSDAVQEMYAVSIIVKNKDEIIDDGKDEFTNEEFESFKKGIKETIDNPQINDPEIENFDTYNDKRKLAGTVLKLNHQINKSVLKDNQLRQGGWGLLEMEASASYLRKIPMEDIENDEYTIRILNPDGSLDNENSLSKDKKHINILKAYIAEEDDKKNHLAYRFFVYKPSEVLIVGNRGITADPSELVKNGIKIIDNLEENKIYPHKLIINCTNNEIPPKPNISRRIVKYENTGNNGIWNYLEGAAKQFVNGVDDYSNNYIDHNDNDLKKNYFSRLKDYPHFLEISMSSTKEYFNSPKQNYKEDLKKKSLAIKIMVVDERIQSYAQEKYKEIGNYTIYRYTNVFVPVKPGYKYDNTADFEVEKCPSEVDLNEQNFDHNYHKIIQYIQNRNDMEFIVIHLGIIEKLIKSYKEDNKYSASKKDDIKNFIEKVICEKNGSKFIDYDRIIITSGRGNPHNLPDDIRYLNFSVVNTYLTDRRNKYALAEACYAARKKNN
jgi:hypothetical protein